MGKNIFGGRVFYGWVIVAAGFLIMAAAWGTVYNCASLFIEPISTDLGFSRSQINATLTIRSATQMIISLLAGKIFSRYDISKLMRIATITLALSYYSYSLVSSLPMIYLITVLVSISITLLCTLPLAIIINNWFSEKKGIAIGIAFMGSGVGGMFLNSLAGQLIVSYGWRFAYQVLAIIMFIVLLPCTFFIIKIRPKKMELSSDEGAASTTDEDSKEKSEVLTLNDAFRTIEFWAICLCSMILIISVNSLVYSASPHLTNIGYSVTFSANIVSMYMGSLAIGKIILGKVFDSFSVRKSIAISCIIIILGLTGLIFSNYLPSIILFVIFGGVGSAFNTIASPIITQKVFPNYDFKSLYGVISAVGTLGSVVGPLFIGFTFDISNSYITSFVASIVFTIISLAVFQIVMKRDHNRLPK